VFVAAAGVGSGLAAARVGGTNAMLGGAVAKCSAR